MASTIYKYCCSLNRVIDGDTIDLNVDLGFHMTVVMRVRLAEIDTPELRGSERKKGLEAKKFVQETLQHAKTIGVITDKIGRYGRYVGDIYYSVQPLSPRWLVFEEGENLNQELLVKGLANKYS